MKPELQEALLRDFPLTFSGLWGKHFDVGNGWEPIVRRCAEKIEPLIAALPPGEVRDLTSAVQVKEKFGGLRFYMHGETPEMSDAIKEAEEQAWKTCEECGVEEAPCAGHDVKTRNVGSWFVTLCLDHYKDRTIRWLERRIGHLERENERLTELLEAKK